MKIAVCISGQPRAVDTCVGSLRQNLLGGLACDFFVHSWYDSRIDTLKYEDLVRDVKPWNLQRRWFLRRRARRYSRLTGQLEASMPKRREEIESQLGRAYEPTRMAIEKQEVFDTSDLDGVPSYIRRGTTPRNLMSMYRSIQRANDLKREHEEQKGFRYDFVVRCRTDLFFLQPFPLVDHLRELENSVLVPTEQNYEGVNDQLAISASQNMDVYAGAFDSIVPFCKGGGLLHPETILAAHLAKQGLEVKYGPIDYEIVRGAWKSPEAYLAARGSTTATPPTR